jgi:TIR domain
VLVGVLLTPLSDAHHTLCHHLPIRGSFRGRKGAVVRIFLSWCHQDARDKDALLRDLVPALGLFADLAVEWWDDSHLICGEDFGTTIVSRIDDADYGLLLLSTRYFSRPFIREHELPRFAGPEPDKGSLPVALSPLPPLDDTRDLGGVQRQLVFTRHGRSFTEQRGPDRVRFANDLAEAIRRRATTGSGYRAL